ncbi:glycosyltransferase [Candidatus Saccharibacteria bacterium]|nr:glycosyltransferase [Candidatus Saccharibacteria bacterium]MCB9834803.1 glycosyltransferase [Candidatus Nomurabacteria bacterium]
MARDYPKLLIIIPTYKEAGVIGHNLIMLDRFLKKNRFRDYLIVVADADSPDGTRDQVESVINKVDSLEYLSTGAVRGKGYQVKLAMLKYQADYKLFMDADFATPLKHLLEVKVKIEDNSDLAVGIRDVLTSHTGLRRWISSIGNILTRVILGLNIADTQCGFKVFRSDVAELVFAKQTLDGWGFDMEILLIAKKYHYKIDTIKIDDWQDIQEGSKISGQNPLGIAIDVFGEMVRVRVNSILGKYS